MRRRYHISSQINWNVEPNAEESARFQQTITAAIRRAIENSADGEVPEIVVADFAVTDEVREAFSSNDYQSDRNSYSIPSYDNGGSPTEVLIQEETPAESEVVPGGEETPSPTAETITFAEEEAEPVTSTLLLHPRGEVGQDRVISNPSPFEDRLIAIFPHFEAVKVRSERYAVASDLTRAIRWGLFLFGARSFVILEGPFGRPESRYYALGTNRAIHLPTVSRGSSLQLPGGEELFGIAGQTHWETEFRDEQSNLYLLRVLLSTEGNEIFPPNRRLAEEFYQELALSPPERGRIPTELARSLVFGEIDRLIANDELEEAAQRLAELDANAFALVNWETKVAYLQTLIDAWTREPQEIAIVEILKSIDSRSELLAALNRLQQDGLYEQLFNDIDKFDTLWSLFVTVGRRFGSSDAITFEFLVDLLQQAGLIPRNLDDVARRITLSPTVIISPDLLAEIEEAARGFVRFLGGSLEAIWLLISEPEKVVEGIAQLVKLAVMVQLAQLGYPPAVDYIGNILSQMSRQVVFGFRGAQILGITGNVLRRIKWAIIWEVASWFIGVGEVRAILSGVGITERVAAIARITRLLGLVGRATEAERIAGKLQSVARIVSRSSRRFGQEDEVLRILSRLPEEDVNRLARALEGIDIDETLDLARLEQRLGDASDTLRRAETLSELATKAGGLSDEVVEVFHTLARRSQLTTDELADVVRLIPEGEGSRFIQTVRTIPETALRPGSSASGDLLKAIAQSPQRMDALLNLGYDTFAAIYRRAGRRAETADQYLNALTDIERNLPVETRATEFRQLLDGLEQGDIRAWIQLEDARRTRFGGERLQGLSQVIASNPRAEAGFERLLRGRHHNVIDDLVEDVLPNSPALARRRFEQIGDLSDEQAEGLAVIQHLDETGDIGVRTSWAEVLDFDLAWKHELLELTAQIHRFVDEGLDLALKRGFQGPGTNVQGTLGHLYAARTLQQRFPGSRFRFEIPAPNREIDIQVSVGGRMIDVEVKTNLGLEPTIARNQIRRDLIRHIDDRFQDILYLYAPQQSGNLQQVEDAMLSALRHSTVQTALQQRGISVATAETWLRQRLTQGLISTFDY
jgi:hypothetical protein